MHEFLNPAFKFLFQNKQNEGPRFAVANKELVHYAGNKALANRASPAAKAGDLMQEVWGRRINPGMGIGFFPELHETFAEFIKYEMD